MTSTPSPPRPAPIRAVPDPGIRFRELYDSHFRLLLGYALRRVAAPEDAADIVAETLLVAWRRFDDVPIDGTAHLWLYGVARRVLANHRRGQFRRDRLAEKLRLDLQEVSSELTERVDTHAAVRQAMDQLSDADRELITLTGWEDLDPKEIAVVLGVPAGVVRTRLHRARRRLKKLLGDAFEGRGHVRDDLPTQSAQEER
jgi:RNA polymerase sigma-70 factor (ECF subfamily)